MGIINSLPESANFVCKKCHAVHNLYLHDQTINFVCSVCGSVINTFNNAIEDTLGTRRVKKYYLEPGQFGIIRELKYLVTGILTKKSMPDNSIWVEYTLFNPLKGFIWLTEYAGNWTLLTEIADPPGTNWPQYRRNHGNYINYHQDSFVKFLVYETDIIAGVGEFHYRLTSVEQSYTAEYILPPEMISFSKSDNEIIWFKGEYLESSEVKRGFGLEKMPIKQEQGYLEVFKSEKKFRSSITLYLVAVLLAALFFIVDNNQRENKMLLSYSGADSFQRIPNSPMMKAGEFVLNNDHQVLQFEFFCPELMNDWAEMQIELINKSTNESRSFYIPLEYYYGFEDGEKWSEGGNSEKNLISNVSKGEYIVNYKVFSSSLETKPFLLTVEQNVTIWRNFMLFVVAAGLIPFIHYLFRRNFEIRRWLSSNLSND